MSRVLLDANDFKKLIKGGIVKQNGVEVALQDIGYELMAHEIRLASMDSNINQITITRKV